MNEPKLLTDEQVRQFITNGFLQLTPDVEPTVHVEVAALLKFAIEKESWYGNNILSRVPKMYRVLDCPVVRGALTSLAGEGYYLHPHRAVHVNRPVEDRSVELTPEVNAPRMGKGSIAGSGWHQDAQSPLSRARHHVPRYLIGFYFPHETPLEMGPTRIQAGSHLHANPVAPAHVVLEPVPAGTFMLVHFDMVHAGFPNRTDETRYMVKFVIARTQHPQRPAWANIDADWRRPSGCIPNYDLPETWGYLWSWLRGEPKPIANGAPTATHLANLDSDDQPRRLASTYALAAVADVDELIDNLLAHAGGGKHERRLAKDAAGQPLPRDDTRGYEKRWNERAVVMQDAAYALAACGQRAVPALVKALDHDDAWVQINAAFALGEMGPVAAEAVAPLTRLLDSPSSQVVRQVLDALGGIGCKLSVALPKIERLLLQTNLEWQEAQVMRGWVAEDQVRMNAASALLNAVNAGDDLDEIERILIATLGRERESCGYVSAIATEALIRIGSPTANAHALRFLSERRWDETLNGRAKAF